MASTKTSSIMITLAALIWGAAFVAQKEGGDAVGPYTFCCVRSFIGAIALMPAIKFLDSLGMTGGPLVRGSGRRRATLVGGACCGVIVALALIFQQVGLYLGTSSGKAGFLTSCYIVLVPIFGLFIGRRCSRLVAAAVALAFIGLWLLCADADISLRLSDALVLICSVLCAMHILAVDRFAVLADGVRMSCVQFAAAGVVSAVPMLLFEMGAESGGPAGWASRLVTAPSVISLLYAGVMSSGVAYTLQIVGQRGLDPTIASILMSLESVFSVIAGWLLLGEVLSAREMAGCAVIFAAIAVAQIPRKDSRTQA